MTNIANILATALSAARADRVRRQGVWRPAVASVIDAAEGLAKFGEAALANAHKGELVIQASDRAQIEDLVRGVRDENAKLAAAIAAS